MLQKIRNMKKSRRGFTLVEIIVVLVILAILAAFTIPAMLGFVQDAREKAYLAEAREVYVACQSTATEYSSQGTSDADIKAGIEAYVKGTAPADVSTAQGKVTKAIYDYINNDTTAGSTISSVTVTDGTVKGFTYAVTVNGKTYTMTYDGTSWTTSVA